MLPAATRCCPIGRSKVSLWIRPSPRLTFRSDMPRSVDSTPIPYSTRHPGPRLPGHLHGNCGSFTWLDKSGNLPDIPAIAVIVNPNYPQQVFAGTDFGLYYTNDITQASPVWYRFDSRSATRHDLGYADRSRFHHPVRLDPRPRRVCLSVA